MRLKKLEITNLRKLQDRAFEFKPGLNAIVGNNARGKTTVLEAIFLLISGKSFRAQRLNELISYGEEGFQVRAEYVEQGTSNSLTFTYYKGEKSVKFNDNTCQSLYGLMTGALLTPDDAHLIKGSPHNRRDFLDLSLCETDPLYGWHLSRYHRALKQRNALLKIKDLKTIESWEHEMAKSASYITYERSRAIKELIPYFQKNFSQVGESDEEVSLDFECPDAPDLKPYYEKEWARLRSREVMYGYTLLGPHKDDFTLLLNNQDAKNFASEGQKQTLLVALKLAEWERIRAVTEEEPLFMIDDLGISMDKRRKERLIQLISTMGQVLITTVEDFIQDNVIILS